jgi:hypothetical protein
MKSKRPTDSEKILGNTRVDQVAVSSRIKSLISMINRCEWEIRENFVDQLEAKTVAHLCESVRGCCGRLRWIHVDRRVDIFVGGGCIIKVEMTELQEIDLLKRSEKKNDRKADF